MRLAAVKRLSITTGKLGESANVLPMLPALKLLLIEDDAFMQTTLQRVLSRRAIEMEGCSDGARPVRRLSARLQARTEGDLTPIHAPDAPRELLPLVDATNAVMVRLQHLLDNQKRFVRDAAHQLRTPLAVLKVQVQSALRGDIDAHSALGEINQTVDRATMLANQMLSLAKVEQLRQQPDLKATDLAQVARAVALDLSPLIAAKDIDFSIETEAAPIESHDWMLTELTRNLLHNAIAHTPAGGALAVRIVRDTRHAAMTIADSGTGISAALAARLFQPFSAGRVGHGSGLGQAICSEITSALGGTISLENRVVQGRVAGLDATVRLPVAAAPLELVQNDD